MNDIGKRGVLSCTNLEDRNKSSEHRICWRHDVSYLKLKGELLNDCESHFPSTCDVYERIDEQCQIFYKCKLWFTPDKNTLHPKRCQISLQMTFTANIISPTITDYTNESNKLTTHTSLKFHGWAEKATHFDEMEVESYTMLPLLKLFKKKYSKASTWRDWRPHVQKNTHILWFP